MKCEQTKEVLDSIEKIQKFIEEPKSKDSHGRLISVFDKLCFVQEDLTKLSKFIKENS